MRLHKGQAVAVGKKSPKSLYSYAARDLRPRRPVRPGQRRRLHQDLGAAGGAAGAHAAPRRGRGSRSSSGRRSQAQEPDSRFPRPGPRARHAQACALRRGRPVRVARVKPPGLPSARRNFRMAQAAPVAAGAELMALSEIVASPIVERQGERIARVKDVIARMQEGAYPQITGIVCRAAGARLLHPDRARRGDHARARASQYRTPSTSAAFSVAMANCCSPKDVLDRQVIDVRGTRVVRVNDLYSRTQLRRLPCRRARHRRPRDPASPGAGRACGRVSPDACSPTGARSST